MSKLNGTKEFPLLIQDESSKKKAGNKKAPNT
jgi:hypothetical protein